MEAFFQAMRQPEYVHVLLNHVPITGLAAALLFLMVALLNRNRAWLMITVTAVGLLSLSAWPVAHYGERAYDRVLAMSDEEGGDYLKHHEELADRWIFLFYATSVAAAAALVIGWRKPPYLRTAAGLVAVLAAASLVAGAVIADYGGKIRHREFRYGPPPAPHEDQRDVTSREVNPSMTGGRPWRRATAAAAG